MIHRRRFLATAAAAAFSFHLVPRCALGGPGHKAPSEKLNLAGIGVGGQGAGDLREMAVENIVALCDVDGKYAAHTFKTYPKAEVFKDYRMLLEKRKDIDAVMIATPDHMHAPITVAALRAGKHVYVEKPMAHTIEEARVMTRVAKETGLVTQMGNNGHGGEGLRLTREWIQAGAIGPVREIHCWSDRPGNWWKQDRDRPSDRPPVPAGLDWNLWLGAAPRAAVSSVVLSRCLAGLVRFRHRGAGRHGHSQHGPGLLRPRSGGADGGRAADQPAEKGVLPGLADPDLRVRREGGPARGETDLVRRRQAAAPPGRARAGPPAGGQRHLFRGRLAARSSAAAGPGRRDWSRKAR